MSEEDRLHWDDRYRQIGPAPDGPAAPPLLAPHEHLFPTEGAVLELACGRGRCAIWLAARGLRVWGLDVSPVAVAMARELAQRNGLADRCTFDVVDLDGGLPDGPPVDLVLCHWFRDARLDRAIIDRLRPGGVVAMVVLSEVDVGPGAFRARPHELHDAFSELEILEEGERSGEAWLVAKRRPLADADLVRPRA